ncbi:MAG: selenocysteine-specific translation elongation factor [Deltaproteobacteria bacterium]|nr:selenocysteine-specific translation elongation factor [Deltaproteobacteria bacterium]
MDTYPIILGTAGHIDHGKTSLVRALTGIDTDRLKEEKERGITIELGFAHLDIAGRRFGLVDVPGHERFIKSMVAGASGVDLVLLVIAADEGVMPQTREHLDICQLLGIRRGIVVLTKVDLVDEAWLELVVSDLKKTLAGTFLDQALVIPVSSRTGLGLDLLREELFRLAASVPGRLATGPFRLPLDRVFTMKGFGTVVTGTILGGRVGLGDDVVALPGGRGGKVRGIQVHGQAMAEARAGMRCAINVGGLERDEVMRGEILSHPGALEPTRLIDGTFRYLSTCRAPLASRARVLVHHATAQLMATVVLAEGKELTPGAEALVQLRLETPISALPGDRFIARGFTALEHYGTTIGGGEIVRVHAPKLRRSSQEAAVALRALAEAQPTERVALEVHHAGPAGMSRPTLAGRIGLSPAILDNALNRLVQVGDLVRDGDLFLHSESLARLESAALSAVDAFHQDKPHKEGIPKEELRSRLPRALPARLFDALLTALVRRKAISIERDIVRRPRHAPSEAARATTDLAEQLVAKFHEWALEPPRPQEIPEQLGLPEGRVRAALDMLVRTGRLVRIKPDYVVDRESLDALRNQLAMHLKAHGQITPQEWKAITGTTRKYSIPLAEHFDAEKVTIRVGEVRKPRGI